MAPSTVPQKRRIDDFFFPAALLRPAANVDSNAQVSAAPPPAIRASTLRAERDGYLGSEPSDEEDTTSLPEIPDSEALQDDVEM